jgi:hypothetical protein
MCAPLDVLMADPTGSLLDRVIVREWASESLTPPVGPV